MSLVWPRPTPRYTVSAYHAGKWGYGVTQLLLGSLDSTGTLVVDVEASSLSGADPYYYFFDVFDAHELCRGDAGR